jgi:hypothetical protein
MFIVRSFLALAALVCGHAAYAAKFTWPVLSPEELAETKAKVEPGSAVEAVVVNLEIDDRDFPVERYVTRYLRYKIYDAEKAEDVTRVSDTSEADGDSRTEFRARLTLPNGSVREFGKESIKERTLAKKGQSGGLLGWLAASDFEVKEKFLAITGVETGAVLEYRITTRVRYPGRVGTYELQSSYPTREATFFCQTSPETDQWRCRTFVLNTQGGRLKEDPKKHVVTFTALNLPSIRDEPFLGPATDNALTVVCSYDPYDWFLLPRSGRVPLPGEVSSKLGQWTIFSTIMNWAGRDRGYVTNKVEKLAATITKGLTEPEAKARAIHTRVQALAQLHFSRSGPKPKELVKPESLDDVLEVAKMPQVAREPVEFVWLELGLCRAAGLEAELLLLPDRTSFRFNPQFVSESFLGDRAVAIRLNGKWVFSAPHSGSPLPFGMLPWENEAQVGLLALDHKQEFIKVPAAPPDQSEITSEGTFSLDAEGNLTGKCTRAFSGHAAARLRQNLRRSDKDKCDEIAAGKFGFDTKRVELKIVKIEGVEDPEKPLLISATLNWPGYAIRMKDRLVIRPSVFRAEASPPFTATERQLPIHFPYRWQESDMIEIRVPEGFYPEAPTAPLPVLTEVFSQETRLGFDRTNHALRASRAFKSNAIDLPAIHYPVVKGWYDQLMSSDQHEIVFAKKAGDEKKPPASEQAPATQKTEQ